MSHFGSSGTRASSGKVVDLDIPGDQRDRDMRRSNSGTCRVRSESRRRSMNQGNLSPSMNKTPPSSTIAIDCEIYPNTMMAKKLKSLKETEEAEGNLSPSMNKNPPYTMITIDCGIFPNTMMSKKLLFLKSLNAVEESEGNLSYSCRLHRVSIDSGRHLHLIPKSSHDISESVFSDGFINSANSCNGLFYFYRDEGDGLLWNPVSGERLREVSFSTSTHVPPTNYRYDHHSGELLSVGLGFDSMLSDYKVVAFVAHTFTVGAETHREIIGSEISMMLYSFKDDSWKPLPLPSWDIIKRGVEPQKFVGAAVYKDEVLYWMEDEYIFAFIVATECFFSVRMGPKNRHRRNLQLVEFRRDLGVVAFKKKSNCFELWAMEQCAWVRQFRFTVHHDNIDEYREYEIGKRKRDEIDKKRKGDEKYLNSHLFPMGFVNELLILTTSTGRIYVYDSISKEVIKSPIPDLDEMGWL